ncbi:1-acyl-sn-glycerol-3-phosphate acyltransferase [Actinotalea sp. K2]|uniref:lysophospholipid acyltransferase family protein n=1 Tax=Actinotalea sp. K2 TaxID=2939438 RepID=UPI002017E87C|nr:lysophospholipid acyltransferase family protein [Actinotalea sp. K2]MCL3862173.1 1-acyl-sn-glycerol-3-phosphate acyltransferase [Actinotalea sp. K2]
MFYWLMKRVLAGPLLRGMFRPWVRGMENIPTEGAAILASNHLAVIDSFVLPLILSRKIRFIGKAEYFTGTGIKGRLTSGFMRGVGTIPVDRGGGKASEGALRTGLAVLEAGDLFGIYPEGTRSPDGRLYRGKTGVARLALESGAPVIPVAMIGTDVAQPIGTVMPKPMRIGIVVGAPLDFSRYKGMENDRFILRSVTDEIMYALMSLSGQEYVDIYAATAKARIAAGHTPDEVAPVDVGPTAPGGRPVPSVQVPVPAEDEGETPVG